MTEGEEISGALNADGSIVLRKAKRTRKTIYGNPAILFCNSKRHGDYANKEVAEKYVMDNVSTLLNEYGDDVSIDIFIKYKTMAPKVVSKVVFE